MTISDFALLDTNVLVYAADASSPHHFPSATLRNRAVSGELNLCICPQVLVEFFAVITDSRRVSNARTSAEAAIEVKKYLSADTIFKVYPKEDLLLQMLSLIEKYDITRQTIFDLQLVATMISNGVSKIYTFNQDHFLKFKEIEVLSP